MGHMSVAGFSLVMGALGTVFFYSGISMGWLYELMGTILGSAYVLWLASRILRAQS